jgi:hypothetical protein
MAIVFLSLNEFKRYYPVPQTEIQNITNQAGWQNDGYWYRSHVRLSLSKSVVKKLYNEFRIMKATSVAFVFYVAGSGVLIEHCGVYLEE